MALISIDSLQSAQTLARTGLPYPPEGLIVHISNEEPVLADIEASFREVRTSQAVLGPALRLSEALTLHQTPLNEYLHDVSEALQSILERCRSSLTHFEHILPDFPLPVHCLHALNSAELDNLRSISVQWSVTARRDHEGKGYPLITEEQRSNTMADFFSALHAIVERYSEMLEILRISMPSMGYPLFNSLQTSIQSDFCNPSLAPRLRVLDLTHTAPGLEQLLDILAARATALEHIIVDQGADFSGSVDCEDSDEADEEPNGWYLVGRHLALLRSKHGDGYALRSLCASMTEKTGHLALFPSRLTRDELREKLSSGAAGSLAQGATDEAMKWVQETLVVCVAWPHLAAVGNVDEDAKLHAEGCGHTSGWGTLQPSAVWSPELREFQLLRNPQVL